MIYLLIEKSLLGGRWLLLGIAHSKREADAFIDNRADILIATGIKFLKLGVVEREVESVPDYLRTFRYRVAL
jgi:hypothetical protein